ncbi:hypothetical protein DL768_009416 [Monosporascus sp. mg162]|nr:hypothetical protein DL768_009416 [Monosporascus sp. mg162]
MAQPYPDSESAGYHEIRPAFYIGQHDSTRSETLTDLQYGQVLNSGFSFVTTPITNQHFHDRVVDLLTRSLAALKEDEAPGLRPDPIVPPLTTEDTSLFPASYTSGLVAYSSPWIDLCSSNHVVSSISRQVLNLEVSYANFCGVRSIIIPGPREDSVKVGHGQGITQYARAIQEAFLLGTRVNLIIHIPMYREPGLEEQVTVLSASEPSEEQPQAEQPQAEQEIDLFSSWDSWHTHAPYFLLCDVGPELEAATDAIDALNPSSAADFPSLAEAAAQSLRENKHKTLEHNAYAAYLRHLEREQEPLSYLEQTTLTNFQDWLQSPLQPLSDNLESVTYEVFEGDPVKYWQYEQAITEALKDWSEQKKPTSSPDGVVIAVAGSGRGPLVTRALRASEKTGVPVQVWAVEKNPNAYVYLLRQNQKEWDGRVTVVKTDMRAWKGPLVPGSSSPDEGTPVYGKVDILVSELLGSFGDNELSPECLDGIQHVLAPGRGISIPRSYTAHLSPVATPRIFADVRQRAETDPGSKAFDTPWVVQLYAVDFVAQRVPDRGRFQSAWEFAHPLPPAAVAAIEARRQGGVAGGGGGSMAGGVGANDHNARHCRLTFVCRTRGVVHGLAGYFESVLYESADGERRVELSTLPDNIGHKSRDMISWFPIFFPLKQPLYVPPDTELEISMWRQTDDTKVWYEWMVEAYMWVGPSQRVKVGASDMCSSRKVACMM